MPRILWSVRRFIRMPLGEVGDQYSIWVGLTYVFNLIVGTGALTLPAVFARAGWGLSTISLVFLAFMSLINVTYVIETMACANAVLKWKRLQSLKRDSIQSHDESDEEQQHLYNSPSLVDTEEPLVCGATIPSRYYSLDRRIELGEMANLFFSKSGRTMFYVTLCVYLYGDLSIYAAAVAKSVMDVVCTNIPLNTTNSSSLDELACFEDPHMEYTRKQCYRVALLTFVAVLGPFVFFNVQKTKYLQMFTTGMRWLAFTIMISLAIRLLITQGPQGKPRAFDFTGVPTLFGACVYSFMCHHSLPGLISPIRGKTRLGTYLALDYALISIFYLLLAFTGAFAFANLNDLYTLNFVPTDNENLFLEIIEYFLALFPVFTLSTSFPIIAITLRNNLQSLFLDTTRLESYNIVFRKLLFPIVTVVPPLLLTYYVEDIGMLIQFTGSFAGTGIQYLIPTFLVISARRHCLNLLGPGVVNKYKSFFSSSLWAVFVVLWAMVCIILVSVNIVEKQL